MSIYGAPTHEHRPKTVNGNMTACADCGVMIVVSPPAVEYSVMLSLTDFVPSWPEAEQEYE